jgi:hypothetical protein
LSAAVEYAALAFPGLARESNRLQGLKAFVYLNLDSVVGDVPDRNTGYLLTVCV